MLRKLFRFGFGVPDNGGVFVVGWGWFALVALVIVLACS